MVTTNSPARDLNFAVEDLNPQEFEEDAKTLASAQALVNELVKKLKPVLKYIDEPVRYVKILRKEGVPDGNCCEMSRHPQEVRAVVLCQMNLPENSRLLLTREGEFLHVSATRKEWMLAGNSWHRFPLNTLVACLQAVLTRAVQKSEERNAAMHARKTMLDKMIAVMNGGGETSE